MQRIKSTFALVLLVLMSLLAACGSAASTTPSAPATVASAASATQAPVAATSAATVASNAATAALAPTAATSAATEASVATVASATQAPASSTSAAATDAPIAGRTQLTLWTHSAGSETEFGVIKQQIKAFNAMQNKYQVVAEAFPQASYNDSVAAASVAGSLPCLLDLDQPTVANFAWSKYISPLPVSKATLADLNAAAVGTYKDQIYSLGQFDVALVNYARKSVLTQYNIRIPTVEKPWTLDEFTKALDTLKASGKFEYPLDVGAQNTGEWWPYAYSPMLQSFGGDLIDRKTYQTAEGALNGAAAASWGKWFQGLFKSGYANPKPADDKGFLQGRIGIWYTGSWAVNDVVKGLGDDALFLPAVDFGKGAKIGGASWQWGISASCKQADAAWSFINYVMQPEQIALVSNATGLVPTSSKAAALTKNYAEGGPFRIFFDMSKKFAVLRPPTPGYLAISSNFEKAGLKIRDGGDVQNALDDAVDAINRDIKDHQGYGLQK